MEKERFNLLKTLVQTNREAALEFSRYCFFQHDPDVTEQDLSLGLSAVQRLAEQEDPEALQLMGGVFYVGEIVEQNYLKAKEYYERAAEKGDSWGLCCLGYCYYYGRDIPTDDQKAFLCFAESAYQDNANAMYKLGDCYYYGRGVEKNYDTAYFWYRNARENSFGDDYVSASVFYRIGLCELYGHGTPKDELAALGHLLRAEYLCYQMMVRRSEPFASLVLENVKSTLLKLFEELETKSSPK